LVDTPQSLDHFQGDFFVQLLGSTSNTQQHRLSFSADSLHNLAVEGSAAMYLVAKSHPYALVPVACPG